MRKALYILSILVIVVSCNRSDSSIEKDEEVFQLSDLIGVWDSETSDLNGCNERLNIGYAEAYFLRSCVGYYVKMTDSKYTFDGNKLVITNLIYTIKELSPTSLSVTVTVYSENDGPTENKIFKRTN